jgi:hypothetical protein
MDFMSTAPVIERSAFGTMLGAADRAVKLRNAPSWVRQAIVATPQAKRIVAPQPTVARSSASVAGWCVGLASCGISVPVRSTTDGQTLPEQFRDDALERMAKAANSGGGRLRLTWGHDGAELCRNQNLDLVMRVVDMFGQPALSFQARLRDSLATRKALDVLEAELVGVSLEFTSGRSKVIERPGIGPVRIVIDAELVGIALVPRGSGSRAAYPACTAAGKRGSSMGPSPSLRDAVRHRAWRELTDQARRMA